MAERGVKEALGASKGLEHGFAHMASALQAFSQALHVAADGERGIAALNDTAAPGSAKGLESAAAAAEEEEGEKEKEKEEGRPLVPMLVTRTAALYSGASIKASLHSLPPSPLHPHSPHPPKTSLQPSAPATPPSNHSSPISSGRPSSTSSPSCKP